MRELTLRGILIGGIITLVFTAANVYLGLKAGLTFATSIPAAVISMALLHRFRDHSVVENNIVQTIASSAGTLAAIIFVLPGLIMVGWWSDFPYWITVAVCVVGGILGVMYSIPLRRALVTHSDLPYPEGVAAAEVLRLGDTDEGQESNRAGMRTIIWGGVASAGYAILTKLRVVADSFTGVFRIGAGGTMISGGLSLALLGVGHLVGLGVGIAMLVGMAISYGVAMPVVSAGRLEGQPLSDALSAVFSSDVRYIGAGAIAVAAVWTLLKIIGPIVLGIKDSLVSARTRRAGGTVDITERDIPMPLVILTIAALMIPVALLLWDFLRGTPLARHAGGLLLVTVVFVLVMGLVIASVCGYMAGLIGSSNSPISGVGVLVVILAALLIRAFFGGDADSERVAALVAYTLFATAVVFSIATISNDNLQDLKTGQLVGATPWKQQVALVIGVVFGSIVIPPVLQLMNTAFGFQGVPGAGPDALAAPQAALISSLAQGVFGGDLPWDRLGTGAVIGVLVILADEVLRRTTARASLPPLAVGMGMYLPMSTTLMITVGSVIGMFYDRWAMRGSRGEEKKRQGTLLATGLIVGEALWGVVYAGLVAATGDDGILAVVGDGFAGWAQTLGVVVFAAITVWLYRRTMRTATRETVE
ncbi:OPT family oligopeptide transporter [Schaalia naturae]|uniref:OPT family oligopeptide transporter n=1 Tax=Schaalia naturae TaxID=635203 RepID=UPI00362D5829